MSQLNVKYQYYIATKNRQKYHRQNKTKRSKTKLQNKIPYEIDIKKIQYSTSKPNSEKWKTDCIP